MNPSLHRILYRSARSEGALPRQALRRTMQDILAASRRNNRRDDLTGSLLFDERYFVQVLEGPLRALEHTFERIQRDPRHKDIHVLEACPIDERSFPSWTMTAMDVRAQADALPYQLPQIRREHADDLVALLKQMLITQGHAESAPVPA